MAALRQLLALQLLALLCSPGSGRPGEAGGLTGGHRTSSQKRMTAFSAVRASDGTMHSWGGIWGLDSSGGNLAWGGVQINAVPSSAGWETVYTTGAAFAAINSSGAIAAWGNPKCARTHARAQRPRASTIHGPARVLLAPRSENACAGDAYVDT